jgi:hypothetical protein
LSSLWLCKAIVRRIWQTQHFCIHLSHHERPCSKTNFLSIQSRRLIRFRGDICFGCTGLVRCLGCRGFHLSLMTFTRASRRCSVSTRGLSAQSILVPQYSKQVELSFDDTTSQPSCLSATNSLVTSGEGKRMATTGTHSHWHCGHIQKMTQGVLNMGQSLL